MDDFCSCINGKSDIVGSCDSFCALKPISSNPVLYVNTLMGAEVLANPKLGNLYNWCTVQLANDQTTPQCMLQVSDGVNVQSLPISMSQNSNSFTANISTLAKNRTWIMKVVEQSSGAQSKESQFRRKEQTAPQDGALKVMPINQYTCLTFGGKVNEAGEIIREGFARVFYYFPNNVIPAPMPPNGGSIVCHDEQVHGQEDSVEYERLETIQGHLNLFDPGDLRFRVRPGSSKQEMNAILETRLLLEFNITATLDLFSLISFPVSPRFPKGSSLGYVLFPFENPETGKAFCPKVADYSGHQPLFKLLGDYMGDTEGLYLSESETVIPIHGGHRTIYNTMFVDETTLKASAFYIENGKKVRADENSLHEKTIYYYWPTSKVVDPLTASGRKLFTVKFANEINGNLPSSIFSERTSDKRIGCIPKK